MGTRNESASDGLTNQHSTRPLREQKDSGTKHMETQMYSECHIFQPMEIGPSRYLPCSRLKHLALILVLISGRCGSLGAKVDSAIFLVSDLIRSIFLPFFCLSLSSFFLICFRGIYFLKSSSPGTCYPLHMHVSTDRPCAVLDSNKGIFSSCCFFIYISSSTHLPSLDLPEISLLTLSLTTAACTPRHDNIPPIPIL